MIGRPRFSPIEYLALSVFCGGGLLFFYFCFRVAEIYFTGR